MASPTNSDEFARNEGPPLQEVIENLGFGLAQVRAALLGGLVWAPELLLNVVSRTIADEWGLQAWQRAAIVSVVSVGVLCGNSMSGFVGDHFGRRLPILAAYAGIAIFSVLTTWSKTFEELVVIRWLLGVSCGVGQPASVAICTEMTPSRWRVTVQGAVQGFFVLGELYCAMLVWHDDPAMTHLEWRRAVLLGALPSIVLFVFAYLFLHQSPLYLDSIGDHTGALAVLKSMRDDNQAEQVQLDFTPRPRPAAVGSFMEPVFIVFSRWLFCPTIVATYSSFVMTMVYYGGLYVFPRMVMLADMGMDAAAALIVGACWELPGIALAPMISHVVPRKVIIVSYLILTSISSIIYGIGATRQTAGGGLGSYHLALMHVGYMGMKVFPYIGGIPVYIFASEMYPTRARNTGSAVVMSGGRIGAMSGPLVFEALQARTGSFLFFFYFLAAVCLVNVLLILPLQVEGFSDVDASTCLLKEAEVDEMHGKPLKQRCS